MKLVHVILKCLLLLQQGRCQYTAVYNNAQAASYAKEKLHGFEYPPGQRLIVKFDYVAPEPCRSAPQVQLSNSVPSSVQYQGFFFLSLFHKLCRILNFILIFIFYELIGVMGMSPGGNGARLPFLSGLPGHQSGLETGGGLQSVPTTNPSPVSAPYHGLMGAPNAVRTAALHTNLATLAETIAQATSLIQAAGLSQGFLGQSPSKHVVNGNGGGADERNELIGHLEMLGALSAQGGIPLSPNQPPTNNNYTGETYDPSYCSVKLPTPQPLAPMDSPVGERCPIFFYQ